MILELSQQIAALQNPGAVLWGIVIGTISVPWVLLLTVIKRWANRLEAKVDGFQSALADTQVDVGKRFAAVEERANDRQAAVLTAVRTHADVVTVPIGENALDIKVHQTRLDGHAERLAALERKKR